MESHGNFREEAEKRRKTARNFSIFLLFILVVSSLGYAFLSNPSTDSTGQTNTESGVRQIGDRWVFGLQGREVSLAFSPNETSEVQVGSLGGLESYVAAPLFLDITNQGILTEVASALQTYPSRLQEACYGNCTRDLPEKNCSDNMVVWQESEILSVVQQDKCVFINGDLRAADAFIYRLFGIRRENL